MINALKPEKDKKFTDSRGWDLIYDGVVLRNYENEVNPDEEGDIIKHYGEILLPLEILLNYLTAILYQQEAEKSVEDATRTQNLISVVKKSLFGLCDVHERRTSERDMKAYPREKFG